MPEQKSIFTMTEIKSILKVEYNISVSDISALGHGSANCFCISDGHAMYFLKEYQSRFTESDLHRETCLIDYLLTQNYPTAEIVPTLHGDLYLRYQDRFILLQKYISGKTYVNQKLPHHLLMESSEWLGKLHSILRHYPLPCGIDLEWLKAFCPDKIATEYDTLLAALEMQKADIFYEHIKCDLLYKKELVYQLSDFDSYDGITYCATHGDYTCFQYICDKDHILAVIDFSSAKKLPVVWEIMRSYVQSTDSCKDGAEFDIDDFCKYVRRYLDYAPLNKIDLAAMPYVYLNQLSRSKYGYKEYLVTKTENRNDLIQFAFWRTDICREIFKKREEISTRLCLLL